MSFHYWTNIIIAKGGTMHRLSWCYVHLILWLLMQKHIPLPVAVQALFLEGTKLLPAGLITAASSTPISIVSSAAYSGRYTS
jgi:hypothetical protein